MICPICKSKLTVLDTRPNYQDNSEVYRKLICKKCGEWYFSEEKLKSITDKEFRDKWERSDRWLMRKMKIIRNIQRVSDAEEN